MYVRIDYTDGCYAMVECAASYPYAIKIDSYLWKAYITYLDHSKAWQELIKELDASNA